MSSARFLGRFCLFVTVVAFIAGCGSSKPRAYPVTGKVTGSEKPLKGVIIRFQPVEEKGVFSSATIRDDGGYDLMTTDGRRGALPGKYKVVFALGSGAMQEAMEKMSKTPRQKKSTTPIMRPGMKAPPGGFSSVQGSGPPEFETPYPSSYGSAETTPKDVEVKTGSNTIDIQIVK